MRRFALGPPTDRKIVLIELTGTRMSVVRMMPDGSTKRTERQLHTEAEARAVSAAIRKRVDRPRLRRAERRRHSAADPAGQADETSLEARPAGAGGRGGRLQPLSSTWTRPPRHAEPVLPRLAPRPVPNRRPRRRGRNRRRRAGRKRRRKRRETPTHSTSASSPLFGVVGAVLLAGLAFIVWDQFIKPPASSAPGGGR